MHATDRIFRKVWGFWLDLWLSWCQSAPSLLDAVAVGPLDEPCQRLQKLLKILKPRERPLGTVGVLPPRIWLKLFRRLLQSGSNHSDVPKSAKSWKQLRDPREISDGHPSPRSPSSGTTGGLEPSAPSPWHKLSKPVQIKQIFVRPLSFFLIKVPHSGWEKTAIVFWIFWPPCWLLILFCCGFYSRFALFVFYLC